MKLCVHHVGGRAGSRPFPVVPAFERDLVSVLYDADPGCAEHARAQNAGLSSELHVLPYCLADGCRTTAFRFAYDPYASSTYEANPDYASFYSRIFGDHDYVWNEISATLECRELQAVSLDHLLGKEGAGVPAPDFLSLDTEGSEHDILRGAQGALEGVLGVYCEVEFHPLYRKQRLYGDIAAFLAERGFHFAGFEGMQGMAAYRGPIGLRADGFLVSSNALFLRSIDHLERGGETRLRERLRKLALISILFDQLEYGLEALRRAKKHPNAGDERSGIDEFLDELQACVDRVVPLYPPTFSEKFTAAQSVARFSAAGAPAPPAAARRGGVREFLKRVPGLGPRLGVVKRFVRGMIAPAAEPPKAYSEVELLLRRHGLFRLAEKLFESRIGQTPYGRPLR
ncbi:MAG: FkbM family methyltransferase [Elusimicrobia bacterium]|nr:FkbM family methyltransferase [Elusimicrobiota bacterium]